MGHGFQTLPERGKGGGGDSPPKKAGEIKGPLVRQSEGSGHSKVHSQLGTPLWAGHAQRQSEQGVDIAVAEIVVSVG